MHILYTCRVFRNAYLSWITIAVRNFPTTSCLMHCRVLGWWYIRRKYALTFHVYVEVDQLEFFLANSKINTSSMHGNSWIGSTEDRYKITQLYSQHLIMHFSLFSKNPSDATLSFHKFWQEDSSANQNCCHFLCHWIYKLKVWIVDQIESWSQLKI